MIVQIPYILFCVAGVVAIFHVQRYRISRKVDGSKAAVSARWWVYNVMAAALCWEAIDAYQYGTPGWPSSRWLLIPSLSIALVWTAVVDWGRRRKGKEPIAL